MMKAEGKIPSVRKLAQTLNVDAMAIYHYYDSKNSLLESIAATLMNDVCHARESGSWQENIYDLSLSYLTLLREYSGLLETFLSMKSNGPATLFEERFMTIIQELNLSSDIEKNALFLLADYLHGYAFALSCNKNNSDLLSDEFLEGPLKLYCRSLEADT